MLNLPSFSEDLLPRHFPKTRGQLEQKAAVAPVPTLPGLSLLLDDDNKVMKPEPAPRVEPKQSFEQWKQQHKAIFNDNAVVQQKKAEKKHVRFETDHQSNCKLNEKRIPSPVSPNLELSYYEGSNGENYCQNQRHTNYNEYYPNHPNHNSKLTEHCDGQGKNIFLPRNDYKPSIVPTFANDNAYNAASHTTMDSPTFNRTVRSESMKENCISGRNLPAPREQTHCHRDCCRHSCETNQNNWEMTNHQTCNHRQQPNGCVSERGVQQQEARHKALTPFSGAHAVQGFKEQLTDDTLLSIMEEQQQHILLQQNQILAQQKQNMIQQNQIFMLQHQVQKLLLRTGSNSDEFPNKLCQNTICDKTSPMTTPKPFQNAINIQNRPTESVDNGVTARSSIGVMTSFLGNVNDGMPNGIQQFNERFTTKLGNEKFIEKIGGFPSDDEYSCKDSMLDKINDAIKNSSAMIDYRNGTANRCASPSRQSDVNISAQALFYEASSKNNGMTNDQKTTDRSFALYMLGMKYDCVQDDASKNIDKRDSSPKQTNGRTNDQVSVNISPEVYDYLKRHGLLKQE